MQCFVRSRMHPPESGACIRVPWECKRVPAVIDRQSSPAARPLQGLGDSALKSTLERVYASGDGAAGAHCIHELWMRGEMSLNIEPALERLWAAAAASIPDWLPMRYVERLPEIY